MGRLQRISGRTRAVTGSLALAAVTGLGMVPHLSGAVADQVLPKPPLPPATRGPLAIAFTPDGDHAVITEGDEGTVALVDTRSGQVTGRIPTGGAQPWGVAAASNEQAVVANTFSGSVALLDLRKKERRHLVPLRGEPTEVVLDRKRERAFVSLAQLDQVAVLELPSLREVKRVTVGRRPRAMALTPDGSTLLVANLQGGDVSLVDTGELRETRRIAVTGINLRGIGVTDDGKRAYVTGQIPANTRVTRETLDIWTNTVFALDLRPDARAGSAEGWIDFSLAASPDPDGIVVLGKEKVAVALSGSDQALLVRTPGPHLRSYDPVIERRVAVGARPRGIAATPDRKQLWIANELDSTVSVLDAATMAPLRRVALGVPSRRDVRLEGRYLFGNASLTAGRQFSCNSCHPDGNTDGLAWEFIHVPDRFEKRNTRNLRGGIVGTAPFRWSGHNKDIEEFVQEEITGLLRSPKANHGTLHAFWNLIDRFPMPPNPYRTTEGELTPQAKRGQALFTGKAGCSGCHTGELHGGTGLTGWVGTTDDRLEVDVPHLHGVYDSSPYLHDGRAKTLEEIFTRYNAGQKHGKAHALSSEELADLLRYVREL